VRYKGNNNAVIVAVSLSVGVLPIASPQLFAHAPAEARLFLDSGIFLTATTAVLLNLFFARAKESET
jgi:NCS2 family nucleobase:cation symporter-2